MKNRNVGPSLSTPRIFNSVWYTGILISFIGCYIQHYYEWQAAEEGCVNNAAEYTLLLSNKYHPRSCPTMLIAKTILRDVI